MKKGSNILWRCSINKRIVIFNFATQGISWYFQLHNRSPIKSHYQFGSSFETFLLTFKLLKLLIKNWCIFLAKCCFCSFASKTTRYVYEMVAVYCGNIMRYIRHNYCWLRSLLCCSNILHFSGKSGLLNPKCNHTKLFS